ncbi:hypothetical protein PGB90_006500 [Kerria lacca]
MKIITVLALLTSAVAWGSDDFCPNYCNCRIEGASGLNAYCSQLDPKAQRFIRKVQHLVISNHRNKSFSLSDNIFVKLGLQKLESIEIVNSSLTEISVKAFQGLSSLFEVNLSDNQLFLIHADTFLNNTNLHKLKLSGNSMQLTQVLQSPHEYLLRSSSLTDFSLSNCQLSQISQKTFSQLRNLRFLTLSTNFLKTIPKDVFDSLEALETLDLSNNLITKVIKNDFKNNKELTELNLQMNPIETLNGINSSSLKILDLGHCKLRILMKESVEGMFALTSLNLTGNQIEVISDDSFTDLLELKYLDLSNNKIIGPLSADIFKKNGNLEKLSLSGNKELGIFVEDTGFIDISPFLFTLEVAECSLTNLTNGQLRGMENLNFLNASNNAIHELHESTFTSSKRLKMLDLSNNFLVSLSSNIFSSNDEMEKLWLNNNAIRELEESTFSNLKFLNSLDLSNNFLISLSAGLFVSNVELKELWLSGNPIKFLPLYTFSHTPNLNFLAAKNCQLERMWDVHKHKDLTKVLMKLQRLDVSDNYLKYVHVSDFEDMEELDTIDLSGNPLACEKPTIQLIEWFAGKQVEPFYQTEKMPIDNIELEKLKWNELITNICPVKAINHAQTPVKTNNNVETHKLTNRVMLQPHSLIENTRNSFTSVDEIVVETDSSIMWPMVLAISILIVALYFIIYLIGEMTHRRRAVAATFATRASSLGGHVRTRGASGSPLYYKLYEECSIPTQPTKTKKNYILDFSPIHTILKKNTYKIMRTNNEANV